MKKPWKVIKIISTYSLLINAGKNAQLKEGDKLVIYTPGNEIFDPDTKESLGTFDFIKAKLEVEQVFDKMALCVSDETYANSALANIGRVLTQTIELKPLDVDPNTIDPCIDEQVEQVNIGDLVRLA